MKAGSAQAQAATSWPVSLRPEMEGFPPDWRWTLLTDVAELVTGHTPAKNKPEYWNGGVSWINLNEIRKLDGQVCTATRLQISDAGVRHSSAVIHPAGTVCMSRTASLGYVTVMGAPMTTSQDFVNWRCSSRIDPQYLMRALRASRPAIRSLASGSTHRTIYVRQAEGFHVLLPPIEEQRRIAAVLDAADALRAKRRQAIAKLDTLTQAIFIDLFGDPGVNSSGWPVAPIGECLESATYGTSKKSGPTGEFAVLRMGNITSSGDLDITDLKYTDLDDKEQVRHLAHGGDVLFNRTNSAELVGKTAVYRSGEPRAYAGYLIRLRTGPTLHPEYLGQFMNMPSTKKLLRSTCKSIVGMANINATEVQKIEIPLPPIGLQEKFARRRDGIDAHRSAANTAIGDLDGLFASLQQRAFRGEL